MKKLHVNAGHLSLETHNILEKRDRPSGSRFTRNGDPVLPFLGELSFPMKAFSEQMARSPSTQERALPRDLWFLHMVAHSNGYEEIVISPHASKHDALPWYDGGNEIREPGEILARQKIRKAHKIPRQSVSGDKVESIATRQVLQGEANLTILPEPEDLPSP